MKNNQPSTLSSAPKTLAAIDIGSNSFHMMTAKPDRQQLRDIVQLGEKVQLAAGMSNGVLAPEAIARGVRCLQRFKHYIDGLDEHVLRVVATNALRVATNSQAFIEPAEQLLGCAVEVISGREEARLVYMGVAHTQPDERHRLVVDIGGGSTEMIVGCQLEPKILQSVQLGCVSYLRFFPEGVISPANFKRAYDSACKELAVVRPLFKGQWQSCVGCSGILLAVEQVLKSSGLSVGGIERAALARLQALLFEFDTIEAVNFQGLIESRRQVFASGLVVTRALFDSLDIDSMQLSNAALRDGVLYELMAQQN